jgi:PAS domain S-box-containing protein
MPPRKPLLLVLSASGLSLVGIMASAAAGWASPGGSTLISTGAVAAGALAAALVWLASERRVSREVTALTHATRELAASLPGAPRRRADRNRGTLADVSRHVEDVGEGTRTLALDVERAEAARRAAEGQLAALLDVPAVGIVGASGSGEITLFGRGAERIFGHRAADVVGQPLECILPPADSGGRPARVAELTGQQEPGAWVGRRKDGTAVPVEVTVAWGSGCGPTALVLLVRDVAAGQRTETALRASETLFRGVFEHSAAGMALVRRDGTFARVNRALCELLGYSEAELLGLGHAAVRQMDEAELGEWFDIERALLSGSIRWYQGEQGYRHKLGHLVWTLMGVSMVPADDQDAPRFLIQVYDVTERKRVESLEAQLRQAQRIEAVGQLAAGVAHDFNNLLMVITGRSHILLHRLPPQDLLRRHVELIQTTAERAGHLTRQLLAFSRRQALEPQVLDLNEIVAGMAPMLRRLIGEQIDLVTVLPPVAGRVNADRAQLEQVVLNLVVNARDAMPRGGRLVIETGELEVDETFVREHPEAKRGAHVTLVVRDTGIGMDARTRARLFEPFFTTKAPGKGTGLGLATVYGIVKQARGAIYVESEPGKGTTFTLYLPRVGVAPDVEPAAAPAAPPSMEWLRGWETILLVEDEEAVRDLAREILHQAGYTVLGARHGGDALVIGDRHPAPIHLLVTDVVMPELGGPDLADRLRERRADLRVVFMSGYTDDTIELHGVIGPGHVLVRKPLTPDALLRTVREVLDKPA